MRQFVVENGNQTMIHAFKDYFGALNVAFGALSHEIYENVNLNMETINQKGDLVCQIMLNLYKVIDKLKVEKVKDTETNNNALSSLNSSTVKSVSSLLSDKLHDSDGFINSSFGAKLTKKNSKVNLSISKKNLNLDNDPNLQLEALVVKLTSAATLRFRFSKKNEMDKFEFFEDKVTNLVTLLESLLSLVDELNYNELKIKIVNLLPFCELLIETTLLNGN